MAVFPCFPFFQGEDQSAQKKVLDYVFLSLGDGPTMVSSKSWGSAPRLTVGVKLAKGNVFSCELLI